MWSGLCSVMPPISLQITQMICYLVMESSHKYKGHVVQAILWMQQGPETQLVMDSIIASFIMRPANITGNLLDSKRSRRQGKEGKGKKQQGKGEKKAFSLILPLPVFRTTELTEVPNMELLLTCFGAWRPHWLTMSCLILPNSHPRKEDYCWVRDGWEGIYLQLLSFPCSWELKGHADLHPWGWRGQERHAVWLRVSQSGDIVMRNICHNILEFNSANSWCVLFRHVMVWPFWLLPGLREVKIVW